MQLRSIRNWPTVLMSYTQGVCRLMRGQNTNRLDDVFCRQRGPLLGIVTRVVGDAVVAEDLVQETYLRVRGAVRERRVDHLQAFLFQTAQNLARDHLRTERRWCKVLDRQGAQETVIRTPCPTPQQDTVVLGREHLGHLEATLLRLTPRQRRVFLDARLHGRSQDTIAADLGVSKSTVQKDLRTAMAACVAAFDR